MAFLDVDGARLQYEAAGSGRPAFVLVHGGMCTSRDWAKQLGMLAEDGTVIAMDLRCHGRSTGDPADFQVERLAGDVNTLVDHLKLAPAILVGHSLGSRIVAEAVWQRPDNAAGLVLLDGSRSQGGLAATAPADDAAPAPMEGSLTDILNLTIGPHADDNVRSYVLESMSAASPEVMQASVKALEDWDRERADLVYPGLAADLPVLAIQSTYHDKFTPRRSLNDESESTPFLDFLAGVHPGLDIAVLPETGHFSMLERPERVIELISRFGRKSVGEKTWPESA